MGQGHQGAKHPCGLGRAFLHGPPLIRHRKEVHFLLFGLPDNTQCNGASLGDGQIFSRLALKFKNHLYRPANPKTHRQEASSASAPIFDGNVVALSGYASSRQQEFRIPYPKLAAIGRNDARVVTPVKVHGLRRKHERDVAFAPDDTAKFRGLKIDNPVGRHAIRFAQKKATRAGHAIPRAGYAAFSSALGYGNIMFSAIDCPPSCMMRTCSRRNSRACLRPQECASMSISLFMFSQ